MLVGLVGGPSRARAQDEGELVLMSEPASFTDVVDAFDDHDPFDVNITIGYLRTWEIGRVQREAPATGDHRMTRDWLDVADYSREVNQLVLGLDVGIFRDLAIYAHLPIILSDDRSLARIGDTDPSGTLRDIRSADPTLGSPLFEVGAGSGFRSPTRSGVDWLAVGAAWAILNQHRDPHVPTWVIMLEGRFNLGEPMHACNEQQLMDPMTGERGRSCLTGTRDAAGQLARGTDPGVGRGVNALRVETRGSFRYEYMEPYAGLAFQMEWPGSGDSFFVPGGNLAGYINELPPIQGRLTVGTAIMPWEDREHYQRFAIDLRFTADYFSEGHDYSPLFDALGSSQSPYLTGPVLEGQPGEGENPTAGLGEVNFYGLTDTQSRVRLGGTLILEMQAARYVRFNVQTTVMHTPSYVITQADACNPNVTEPPGGDERLHGTCRRGIINPHHRTAIDLPGQRFRMESITQIDVGAYVTAQF